VSVWTASPEEPDVQSGSGSNVLNEEDDDSPKDGRYKGDSSEGDGSDGWRTEAQKRWNPDKNFLYYANRERESKVKSWAGDLPDFEKSDDLLDAH
jgi:hypothetical protein